MHVFSAERGNARKYIHFYARSAETLKNIYILSARSAETLENTYILMREAPKRSFAYDTYVLGCEANFAGQVFLSACLSDAAAWPPARPSARPLAPAAAVAAIAAAAAAATSEGSSSLLILWASYRFWLHQLLHASDRFG